MALFPAFARLVLTRFRWVFATGDTRDAEIVALRHQILVLQRQVARTRFTEADRTILAVLDATTTAIGPTEDSTNEHPTTTATSSKSAQRSQSADTRPAAVSSTNTNPLHEPRTQPTRVLVTFTVDTVTLRRFYLLFFIDIPTRTVYLGGITEHPTGTWTTQVARSLLLRHRDRLTGAGALVRHRGSQFVGTFDEIFRTEGLKILKTPVRAPVANAFAERWIGTLRRELLDRTLIWNHRQLERLVVDYIDHYNAHRPHRSLNQSPPHEPKPPPADSQVRHIVRSTRCNGLINEYRTAAWTARTQYRTPTGSERIPLRPQGRDCVYFRPGPASWPDLRIGRAHDNRPKC